MGKDSDVEMQVAGVLRHLHLMGHPGQRDLYMVTTSPLNSVFESCEASRSDDVPPHERAQNEMQMALSRVPKQLFDTGIMLML